MNFKNSTHHNIFLLQDESILIKGYRFYGSSWQVQWKNTGFYKKRGSTAIKNKWEMIPKDTDVLITHSPSFGPLFDDDLRNIVNIISPKLHIFGHVHKGQHGIIHEYKNTKFVKSCIYNVNNE